MNQIYLQIIYESTFCTKSFMYQQHLQINSLLNNIYKSSMNQQYLQIIYETSLFTNHL